MKHAYLPLLAATLLLASCGQNATTEQPAATTSPAPVTEQPATPTDSAAAPADATATTPPAALATAAPAETIKASFDFKPVKDEDNPSAKRSSAHLVLTGKKPQDIDLGRFAGKPDVVDAEKAKLANFPADMLMGFRSYDAASGISADLAVLNVGGHHLRVVQRKIDEQATEPGKFETAREIPLPAGTVVVKK